MSDLSPSTSSPQGAVATGAQLLKEQRRRQVITFLGTEPLVSRFDAPGAASPVRLLAPGPVVAVGSAEGATNKDRAAPSSPGSAAIRAQMDQLRSGLGAPEQAAAKKPATAPSQRSAPQEPVRQSSVNTAPAVSFSLLLATCGRWLWVEELEEGLLRREQLQLIHAMSRAIDGPEVSLSHRQFDWPLANHAHLPKDLESACQSVAGQSQRLAKEVGAVGVIAMGDAATRYLGSVHGLQRVKIPGTLDMLRDPSLKKHAWQVLKPLIASQSGAAS